MSSWDAPTVKEDGSVAAAAFGLFFLLLKWFTYRGHPGLRSERFASLMKIARLGKSIILRKRPKFTLLYLMLG